MSVSKTVASFRVILKILLIIILLLAASNSVNNLLHPSIGVNLYQKPGTPLRSITICPNLHKNSHPAENVTNFPEFLTGLPSMHDLMEANIINMELSLQLNLKDEASVKKYFGFYAYDIITDTFLIRDDLEMAIFKCATWNVQEYFEYFLKTNSKAMNSQEIIHQDQLQWENAFFLDLNNSNNVKIVALKVEQSLKLDKQGSPCDTNGTRHQKCLADFLEANLGCNIFRKGLTKLESKCSSFDEFKKVIKLIRQKKACMMNACKTFNWKHRIIADTYMEMLKGNTYVYFVMQGDETEVREEKSLYGFSNFFADFGGYLGLLLGASILSMYDSAAEFLTRKLK